MNRVLLLNSDYEPLHICTLKRAIKLLILNKAESLHCIDDNYARSGSGNYLSIPSVIRLRYQVKRKPKREIKVSRIGIYNRDNFTCQYCGIKNKDLTLDHVYPRHLGGSHTWDNLVTCCKKCNHFKAWRTVEQSGMKLMSKPKCPKFSIHTYLKNYAGADFEEWNYYLV
jgi:5-methylcytosine-specific restriction endonuclease McrA